MRRRGALGAIAGLAAAGAAACISFDIRTWTEIRHKSGKQEFYLKPERDL